MSNVVLEVVERAPMMPMRVIERVGLRKRTLPYCYASEVEAMANRLSSLLEDRLRNRGWLSLEDVVEAMIRIREEYRAIVQRLTRVFLRGVARFHEERIEIVDWGGAYTRLYHELSSLLDATRALISRLYRARGRYVALPLLVALQDLLTVARYVVGKGISNEGLHTYKAFDLVVKAVSVVTVRNAFLAMHDSLLRTEDVEKVVDETAIIGHVLASLSSEGVSRYC